MFLHLGRPIQDLQFWTSFEVGQVYVPNAFVQISSIMPQKRNPVPIEHLRHLASQTVGRARAMLDVVHNTPFTDMNDSEGETQEMGYGAFASAARVLDLLTALLPALRIDGQARRRKHPPQLHHDHGTRRQPGPARGPVVPRGARDRARPSRGPWSPRTATFRRDGYAPFAAAFLEATGRPPAIDARRFAEIVSPEHFVAVRDRFGGPAPAALDAALARYRAAPRRGRARGAAIAEREARPPASSPNASPPCRGEP